MFAVNCNMVARKRPLRRETVSLDNLAFRAVDSFSGRLGHCRPVPENVPGRFGDEGKDMSGTA
jgi:hypothetical protein